MKLKNVQAYPIENVPDFLVEECKDLGIKMLTSLIPYFQKHHPNIILGAMAFIHASMIKNQVFRKEYHDYTI